MPRKSLFQTSPNSPLPLPPNILWQIFFDLYDNDRRALASCCRVSKSISSLASQILYRDIVVSPLVALDSRLNLDPKRFKLDTVTGQMIRSSTQTSTRKRRLIVQNTRIVKLDFHRREWCGRSKLHIPRLHTLRLDLLTCGLGPVLHGLTDSEAQCSLLKSFQPVKLVLFGASLNNIGPFPIGFPTTEKAGFYDKVEKLVFIVPSINFTPNTMFEPFPPMKKLKQVVWIIYTALPGPKETWKFGTHSIHGEGFSPGISMGLFAFSSAIWFFQGVPVTIVNAGSMDRSIVQETEWHYDKIEAKIREHIEKAWLTPWMAMPREETNNMEEEHEEVRVERVRQRMESIRFVTMPEYLRTEDWEGELSQNEVKGWSD